MPNLSRNLPRNVTYYLLSSVHTYSEAVMIVPVLGRERKYFPQTWRPHSLVGGGLEEDEDELEENETVLDDC